ncbi:hypothetical protein BH10CHL1_BH10CHL1_22060 [soil metagenome]
MSETPPQSPKTDFVRSVTESTEKVERIRKILFGAQMREQAQKLASIQQEVRYEHTAAHSDRSFCAKHARACHSRSA